MKLRKLFLASAWIASSLAGLAKTARADTGVRLTPPWKVLFQHGVRALGGVRAQMGKPPRTLTLEMPRDRRWLGDRLQISLLGRNRGSTTLILGDDQRSAVDFASVRRSTRMVVDRLALTGGRLRPFAQIGAGEWRADVDRRCYGDKWFGATVGAGLQIRATAGLAFAIEADDTLLRNPVAQLKGYTLEVRSGFVGLQLRLP